MNRRTALFGGGAVAGLCLLGLAVVGVSSPASPTPAPAPAAASSTASASAVAPAPTLSPAPAPVDTPAAKPTVPAGAPAAGGVGPLPVSVSIPSLKVMSTLIPLGLNADGTVEVPDVKNPGQAGFYKYDAMPGDVGSAILLGHVDGSGMSGVFAKIGTLALGAEIDVARADGSTVKFSVAKVQTVLKTAFPSHSVYDPSPDAELKLITCGGNLDRAAHNYLSSVIITAKLIQ